MMITPSISTALRKKAQASKNARMASMIGKLPFWSPLKGVSARELPRVPLYRIAFALVRDVTQVLCGGEVTGTKLCLRKCGSKECTNHTPGHPLVTDNTLYVRSATSGTALTTVFHDPTLCSITGLEKASQKTIISPSLFPYGTILNWPFIHGSRKDQSVIENNRPEVPCRCFTHFFSERSPRNNQSYSQEFNVIVFTDSTSLYTEKVHLNMNPIPGCRCLLRISIT